MNIRVDPASAEEKPLLRSLLADCLTELSQYGDVNTTYPYFDAYWDQQDRRWPYIIRYRHDVVGFVLVNAWSSSGKGTDFAMAEFYIAPEVRRSGIGHLAATTILLMHTGLWELGIMPSNALAQRFWPKAIAAAQATALEQMEGDGEIIYRFSIK